MYLTFTISLILAIIVALRSENSPDYYGYEKYIDISDALDRFTLEPVSAIILGMSGSLGSVSFFYFITTFLFCISCYLYLVSINKFNYITWLIAVINPYSMIILLSPRNSLAISLVIFAMSLSYRFYSILLYILAFGAHNLGSIASLFSKLSFHQGSIIIRYTSIFALIVANIITLSGIFVETRFDLSDYSQASDEERGTLRGIYFIFLCLYIFLFRIVLNKKFQPFLWPLIVALLSYYINSINPFYSRVVTSLFIFMYFYIIELSSKRFLEVVLPPILFINLIIFFAALTFGLWGY